MSFLFKVKFNTHLFVVTVFFYPMNANIKYMKSKRFRSSNLSIYKNAETGYKL